MLRSIQRSGLSPWKLVRRSLHWLAAAAVLWVANGPQAQTQSTSFNREVVVLDPAHGGADSGVRISDSVAEKDVTLQLAGRLRSLLAARGFTVVSTRDISAGDNANGQAIASTQRAELANKAHAVACLVVHATGSGSGVHIGASSLGSPMASITGAAGSPSQTSSGIVPWDRAQEAYVTQSLQLANQVGTALTRSNVALAIERVAIRPLDNLMCPAISIELAPQKRDGQDTVPASNGEYQQAVAVAIAGALVSWRNQAQQPEFVPVPRPGSSLAPPASLPHPPAAIEPGA